MPDMGTVARALLLLGAANALPWLAGRILGARLSWPLDFGVALPDGARLLGQHKTIRGFLTGILGCALTAAVLGFSWQLGMEFGALSMLADAVTSSLKRRLGVAPGRGSPLVDSVPEAVLPLVVLRAPLGLGAAEIAAALVAFMLLDLARSILESRLGRGGVRQREVRCRVNS